MSDVEESDRVWVCMRVQGEHSIHTSLYDTTLGFWEFVLLNTVDFCLRLQVWVVKTTMEAALEILFYLLLEGSTQHLMYICCTYRLCLKRNQRVKKHVCLLVSSWMLLLTKLPQSSRVKRDCAMFPLHHWFRQRRCWIHSPGNSWTVYKTINTTPSIPLRKTEEQTKRHHRDKKGIFAWYSDVKNM